MSILAKCTLCNGTCKVAKSIPLGANPRAPLTRSGTMGVKICPKCNGTGSIGIK